MAAFLLAMALITGIDVVGRYLFNAPLPGGYEIVQYLMALAVFAALPLATRAEGHLTIDLFIANIPQRFQRLHRAFVLFLSGCALALIAWRMGVQAAIMDRTAAASGSLGIPLAPIAYVLAVLGWVSFGVCVILFVLVVLGKSTGPAKKMHMEEFE